MPEKRTFQLRGHPATGRTDIVLVKEEPKEGPVTEADRIWCEDHGISECHYADMKGLYGRMSREEAHAQYECMLQGESGHEAPGWDKIRSIYDSRPSTGWFDDEVAIWGRLVGQSLQQEDQHETKET